MVCVQDGRGDRSHFVLELLPHLELPQGKDMYIVLYNTVPVLLNFSM